ncbi:hypothetical protein Pse7367_1030 [Thalassoporum mexicanum PCC 7367]|uniref:nucleotidyl transferase AbiEii/AbiGii toxin family protein n=1 Tax=Thalassoporum mexicanum TaxID=3457544 RepID=UPI00029FAA8E|nr:nucleotidyl transferase AbiEii/AbiGii toxin family protein [Pseudanabaena sp. PCC 7367]AFY69328.1 hypothetical protein Pse7367_1030 [Pseudanabaena sp. PCC 7367]
MNEQIQILEQAASLLSGLEQTFAFIGSITIALYLEQVSALEVRPTKDVDCVVKASSKAEYYSLFEQLRQIGLHEDSSSGVICRWRYQEKLIIDIMPTNQEVLGFANRWYDTGLQNCIPYNLPSGTKINIFPVAYLLATKIEAFEGRGNRDFYSSKDFEDIVSLVNGCLDLEVEIQGADREVKTFIIDWFHSNLEILQ